MIRHLLALLSVFALVWANPVEEKIWPVNQTFFDYLVKNQIPTTLLAELGDEEKGAVRTIFARTAYHEHRDEESGKLLQALIPISEELQISLCEAGGKYTVALIPVRYQTVAETLTLTIENGVVVDLQKQTGNSRVATELSSIFDDRIDFRRDIRKGDQLSVIYERKVRLGKTWGTVNVKSAFVETNKKRNYAFYREEDEGYYDEKGRAMAGMFLKYPLDFRRISSGYQPSGRAHPVLGYVRPHLGTDFVAPVGTPIRSVADGVVRFRGCQNGCHTGYGRLVVIEHKNGWETRYAHLNGFARNVGQGTRVKQGQVVGYLGGSGLVSGPHLHFEVRKAGRTTNPLALKSIKQDGLKGKELETFIAHASRWRINLDYVADTAQPGVTRLAALELPSGN